MFSKKVDGPRVVPIRNEKHLRVIFEVCYRVNCNGEQVVSSVLTYLTLGMCGSRVEYTCEPLALKGLTTPQLPQKRVSLMT